MLVFFSNIVSHVKLTLATDAQVGFATSQCRFSATASNKFKIVNNSNVDPNGKFRKVQLLVDQIQNLCLRNFKSDQVLSADDITPWASSSQTNRGKPIKFVYKL